MNFAKILFSLVFIIFMSGCTSMKAVDPTYVNSHSDLIKQIEIVDVVRITTQEGLTHELKIKSINTTAISGDDINIVIADIKQIEKREISILKNGSLVLGIISIIVMACCFIVA